MSLIKPRRRPRPTAGCCTDVDEGMVLNSAGSEKTSPDSSTLARITTVSTRLTQPHLRVSRLRRDTQQYKPFNSTSIPVGAGLPAMAFARLMKMSHVPAFSVGRQLPQVSSVHSGRAAHSD